MVFAAIAATEQASTLIYFARRLKNKKLIVSITGPPPNIEFPSGTLHFEEQLTHSLQKQILSHKIIYYEVASLRGGLHL
ncbi:MAG: hypothetical protein KDK41_08885 [Leptospiraceae bacterium]|nr:hypothetical protein [Leptospiraceae bacterium]